ncbi:carboxylating nicotinate-nucleotide diphosphorylase [Aneurinibacillus sp. Ricciae_BoGa-3]|uniref:carboxylating nicotinate-nucleotide diphosphorylase n=1 Tax=Aneurinibacillus sp. Ricciae_BoGa-3 TaxID=3022697 RepID=UPI00234001D0|nr:carboxylating nicotinate-nucleotide diphosphorylase [Aneurinibacillus sp. Ricciae_BoGa-3]WCK54859.1 carboxylating nicotinate-nucleotide diphosphorylase [Aneurinibacillus sp. Ricciae_BoGa-3]
MFLTDQIYSLIRMALQEDIGRGDYTTNLLIDETANATANVYVKEPCCVAGLPLIDFVFKELDPNVQVKQMVEDGFMAEQKTLVCVLSGPARSILTGERTALNFLGRLTGIATKTREAADKLAGTRTKLLDTRKTTPGWRGLEKYAVSMGGGYNHRFGLDDMVMIKDNHVLLAGGISNAIERVRKGVPLSTKIEIEVDTLEQLKVALDYTVDLILLDNMDCETMAQAVEMTAGKVPLEASGNMTLERLADVARTGVDYISMGALTHSAVSIDVGLDIVFEVPGK